MIPTQLQRKRRKSFRRFTIDRFTKLQSVFSVGDPGSAKSSGLLKIAEIQVDKCGKKIVDIYSAGRGEGIMWGLPSIFNFWRQERRWRNKFFFAKAYKTKLLYPMCRKLPKNLPANAKVFTLPTNSIDDSDVHALLGDELKKGERSLWESIVDTFTKNTTGMDLNNTLYKLTKDKKVRRKRGMFAIPPSAHGLTSLALAAFKPLIRENFLSSATNPMALDLIQELKEKDTISVLVLKHFPPKLWGFVIHYFINHLYRIKQTNKSKVKAYILCREVSDILEKSIDFPSGIAIRNTISRILRQQRIGLYFLFDTQHPESLPNEIRQLFHTVLVYSTPAVPSAIEITGLNDYITKQDKALIPHQKTGWCYVFKKDEETVFQTKMVRPYHRLWEEGENPYEVWEKESDYKINKWIDSADLTKPIFKEIEESKNKWEKMVDEEKAKKEVMKEKKRKTQEKISLDEKKRQIEEEIELKKYKRGLEEKAGLRKKAKKLKKVSKDTNEDDKGGTLPNVSNVLKNKEKIEITKGEV